MNKLQKSHEQANFMSKLMKYDKYAILRRIHSTSFDSEEIKEEEFV